MTTTFYGTAASVKTRTGINPDDLGLDDDAALTAFLEGLLLEATDLMDRRMRKSFLAEVSIPAGLNGIANDVCADSVKDMVATRQTPVVRIDDFAVRTIAARIFTPDVEKRLRLYGASGAADLDVTPGDLSPWPTAIVNIVDDTNQ